MKELIFFQFKFVPDYIFFVAFLTQIFIVVFLCFIKRRNMGLGRVYLITLLGTYIFIMFCSTVFFREPHPDLYRLKLLPFWNYNQVFLSGCSSKFWEVMLNVMLYIPIGFILGCLCKRIVPVVFICLMLSVVTEVLQFFLHKGLCETDDVIHNTLGALVGFFALNFFYLLFQKMNYKNI